MPRLAVILALALPALAAAQPAAAPDVIDAAPFVAQLDDLAARARQATPEDASALARELPSAWNVRSGATIFHVPTRALGDVLRSASATDASAPQARTLAVEAIEAMRAEAANLTRGGPAPPAHLRGALQEVLAAPEFRGRQRYAGLLGVVDRFKKWLRSWLPSGRDGEAVVMPILNWLSWIVAGAAFVLLAALVWRMLRRSRVEAPVRGRAGPGLDPTDARTWARRAADAAAAGQARDAIRCAYHAVLHRLDEDGAWTLADDRTPREYVRLLAAGDGRQPAVAFVARLFEGTWYGGAEPALDDAHAAVRHLSEIGCDVQADPAT